jgi:serine protease DegQ
MNKTRILIPFATVALIGGVAAGCGGSTGTGIAASPNGGVQLTPSTQSQTQTQTQVQPSPSLQAVGDPYDLIPSLVERVQPSIVSIVVTTQQGGAQGSGVVYNGSRGIIVTNNHVVAGANTVQVVLSNGDKLDAKVLATDPEVDLAVIQVAKTDLPTATFAKKLPRVGELAVAMGNPLGFENSVTAGIVSALHRSLGENPFIDLIQTDAPISPGNSGGALVNREGEIMGINSAGIPSTENANSLGFAIPSPTVISIVNQLLETGQASHAFLGISSEDTNNGVVIRSVSAGSGAEAAGLQPNDVIVSIDGEAVHQTTDLVSVLRTKAPGDTVNITVERGGQQVQLTATLGERQAA